MSNCFWRINPKVIIQIPLEQRHQSTLHTPTVLVYIHCRFFYLYVPVISLESCFFYRNSSIELSILHGINCPTSMSTVFYSSSVVHKNHNCTCSKNNLFITPPIFEVCICTFISLYVTFSIRYLYHAHTNIVFLYILFCDQDAWNENVMRMLA